MNWQRMGKLASDMLLKCLMEHLFIVILTVVIAVLISVPLGILLTRPKFKKLSEPVIGVLNILQTIPSLALISLTMPLLGIGIKPTIMVLTLMSILPILKNFIAGVNGVDISIMESAKGMGMNSKQVLMNVEIPLAMPVIITGIRTTTVIVVASATLASMINAGGLGEFIFLGLAMNWPESLLLGGISCAVMASLADAIMAKFAASFIPPGMTMDEI